MSELSPDQRADRITTWMMISYPAFLALGAILLKIPATVDYGIGTIIAGTIVFILGTHAKFDHGDPSKPNWK